MEEEEEEEKVEEEKPKVTPSKPLKRSISGTSMSSFIVDDSKRSRKAESPTKRRNSSSTSIRQRKTSESSKEPSHHKPSPNEKKIRQSVVHGFFEALKSRLEKAEDLKVDADKIERLAEEIEEALFRVHNKDAGHKYRLKYRSLIFNIKDGKNTGLFRKIAEERISPKHLVSLTAEEMASKELQQWRKAELEHDIEKIKTTELDKISHGDKFFIKSHKGDMVLEDKKKEKEVVKLPEEDVIERRKEIHRKTWDHGKHGFESRCDVCAGKMTMDEFVAAKAERDKRRSKDRHRHSKHHHHSSTRHHHHSSSRRESDKKKPSSSSHHSSSEKKEPPVKKVEEEDKVVTDEAVAKVENIIKEALAVKVDVPVEEEPVTSPPEVTSTVSIKSPDTNDQGNDNPAVWSGSINMPDVAKFSVLAKQVSGTTDYLTVDLKESMKIVGRIAPQTVWDYIKQIKENPSKEVLVVRLQPASDDERIDYDSFFTYLQNRKRYS